MGRYVAPSQGIFLYPFLFMCPCACAVYPYLIMIWNLIMIWIRYRDSFQLTPIFYFPLWGWHHRWGILVGKFWKTGAKIANLFRKMTNKRPKTARFPLPLHYFRPILFLWSVHCLPCVCSKSPVRFSCILPVLSIFSYVIDDSNLLCKRRHKVYSTFLAEGVVSA